jgi:hypothetical protein
MHEPRRCIAAHAVDSDFAPTARVLLWKLGYALVPASEPATPQLRIVREDRLPEVEGADEPIILLAHGRRARSRDSRVVGRVNRPGRLHEIYRLLQVALEPHPRAVPRVATDLVARGTSDVGDYWDFIVRSLSESGCLITGPKLPPLDTALTLSIEMPWGERIDVPGDAAYEQRDGLGIVFHGMRVGTRRRLAKLVLKLLERS